MKTVDDYIEYLNCIHFEKHLNKISKRLKNKKILLYGAGIFCETILKNFDLSNLDIIGIVDKKFTNNDYFCDLKTYHTNQIINLKPDYILVSTLYFVKIIEELDTTILANSNIKIKPLINKPFFTICREIWR